MKGGGEKETLRKVPKQFKYIKIYWKESMYAWECMNMWHSKENCLMGSAQSNPTSTQSINIYNTYLNAWKYSYNSHEMQCMKFLRSILKNPYQKFCKNLFDFEKPQNFQISQKLRLKIMNCMNMRDLDTYQVKNSLI